jgi:uncharacterized membrane protein
VIKMAKDEIVIRKSEVYSVMWIIGIVFFAFGFMMLIILPVRFEAIKIERVIEIIVFLGLFLMSYAAGGKSEVI